MANIIEYDKLVNIIWAHNYDTFVSITINAETGGYHQILIYQDYLFNRDRTIFSVYMSFILKTILILSYKFIIGVVENSLFII